VFPKCSKSLRHTQPATEYVPGFISPGIKWLGREAGNYNSFKHSRIAPEKHSEFTLSLNTLVVNLNSSKDSLCLYILSCYTLQNNDMHHTVLPPRNTTRTSFGKFTHIHTHACTHNLKLLISNIPAVFFQQQTTTFRWYKHFFYSNI